MLRAGTVVEKKREWVEQALEQEGFMLTLLEEGLLIRIWSMFSQEDLGWELIRKWVE
jgi:hypothetical protein